ncbi:hypothetical protein JM946_02840 [Steroidobacter sp. S1-65]|uniref:Uncharacterized protein n=1 Tax=Steroidobacter gossypii TaxID=2805490 RepID=A0ABS1WRQ7_9GAMM|nr:hypothetical protein [Steroidobacter gossypii]MBM0103659.1 hypothetical protein [Steroidobacter gossypii]
MPHIELPRAIEDYFAFAETEPTRNGRRFSITLPYLDGERLDRLQWWYHITPAQEQMYDGTGLAFYRNRAVEQFRRHIERWLDITSQRFHGDEPIPRLGSRQAGSSAATIAPSTPAPAQIEPVETIAIG